MTRLVNSLDGQIGKILVLEPLLVNLVSQKARATQQTAWITSVVIIAALLHANCVPPSCSAKFRENTAKRKSVTPSQSMVARVDRLIFRGTMFLGKAQKVTAIRTTPMGTLRLRIS